MIYHFLRIMNPDIFFINPEENLYYKWVGQAFCDVTGWNQEEEGVKKRQNHVV